MAAYVTLQHVYRTPRHQLLHPPPSTATPRGLLGHEWSAFDSAKWHTVCRSPCPERATPSPRHLHLLCPDAQQCTRRVRGAENSVCTPAPFPTVTPTTSANFTTSSLTSCNSPLVSFGLGSSPAIRAFCIFRLSLLLHAMRYAVYSTTMCSWEYSFICWGSGCARQERFTVIFSCHQHTDLVLLLFLLPFVYMCTYLHRPWGTIAGGYKHNAIYKQTIEQKLSCVYVGPRLIMHILE